LSFACPPYFLIWKGCALDFLLFLFPGLYEKFNLNLFVERLLCTQTKNVFIFVPKINPTSHRVVYSTTVQPGILSLFQYSLLGRR
jgi:hypothetical protein